MSMCVCVFGLLCSEAMGHIRSGGSSRDACALIFPASINLSRGVFEENSLFVLIEKRVRGCLLLRTLPW